MTKVLNRGLNFCVAPLKLNLTEILVDFRKFERKLRWREFWADKEGFCESRDWIPDIFPKEKTAMPTTRPSTGLSNFINGVKSELLGTFHNKTEPNITPDETEALKTLILMQKTRKIVIKPCDKGAGLCITNFEDYAKSVRDHLESKAECSDVKCYREITKAELEKFKVEIDMNLKMGHATKQISDDEFAAMKTGDKGPGKIYHLFKVHKAHEPPNLPPGRPIVSGCNSITENISKFVDFHAKELVPEIPSYLQDTPDFLRHIEELKKTPLPKGSFPVSIDVVGLYGNIPHDERIECMRKALDNRADQTVTF